MLEKIRTLKNKYVAPKKTDKKTSDKHVVALDIGTEFVKVLIGRVSGDNVEIVGVGRKRQQLADMQAGAIADIASVVSNCNDALNQAEQMAGVSASTCVIGIAGELVKGTTITVRFRRANNDKELDIEEVEKIIGMVQERAEKRAKKQMALEMGGKDLDVRLVNSALVRIEIDGYPVTNPVGFRGREVMVQLYTAFAPMIHIGALERTAAELDLTLLAVAAEPFAVSRSVIGDDPNADMSAILMDVGGGTTDIAVLNNGGVQGTKMFGIGGRAFTQAVAKDLSVDFATAESLKMGLASGKTPTQKIKEVEAGLQRTLEIWQTGVEIALGEFVGLDHLPHRLLLCGGGSSLEMLVKSLQQSNWYSELPFTRKPVIQYISPTQVSGIVDKTEKVTDHTYITAMGLLRVALDTQSQQDGTKKPRSLHEKLSRVLSV